MATPSGDRGTLDLGTSVLAFLLPVVVGASAAVAQQPAVPHVTWHEAMLWLEELRNSGRQIVGADLVEVSPGEDPADEDTWDAIVGARLLYRLIGFALSSRG